MLAWAGSAARRPPQQAAGAAEGQEQQPEERRRKQKGQQSREKPLVKPRGSQQLQHGGEQRQRQRNGAQSITALTALGTVALYTSLRGGISVFHHMRRSQLRRLLHDLAAALSELECSWWLDFGSLLGVYRDGDLIPHDNDIDVAVMQPDWDALLAGLQRLLGSKYSVRIVVPSDDPTTRFIRVYTQLGMADVFGAQPRGDDRILVDCGHGSCTEISRAAVLPPGVMTWRGSKISVPGDVPAALVERYGADWHIPKYMDKGADVVEGQKLYARIFRALSNVGIRL